jgi:hypothetical protein
MILADYNPVGDAFADAVIGIALCVAFFYGLCGIGWCLNKLVEKMKRK